MAIPTTETSVREYALSEKAIIGCLVLGENQKEVLAELTVDDFQFEGTKRLYAIIQKAYIEHSKIDETIIDVIPAELKSMFVECIDFVPALSNWQQYISNVTDNTIIARAKEIGSNFALNEMSREEIQAGVEELNSIVSRRKKGNNRLSMKQGVMNVLSEQYLPKAEFIQTGYSELDTYVELEKGDFVIVGARPSAGKTAFTVSLANNMVKNGLRVAYFSLETNKSRLKNRFFANLLGIPLSDIKHRKVTIENYGKEKIKEINKIISDTYSVMGNLDIVQASGYTAQQIRMEAELLEADVIFIDYIGLVTAEGKNRYEKMTNISMDLHNMAQQTGIVVIALSQLNRSGTDKHPQMTELRESGQIEQDADLILLMHKGDQIPNYNGYYDGKFQTTIIIEKNKEGMTGKVPFIFNGVTQQFFLNTEEYAYE